jgi:hypothetical protein
VAITSVSGNYLQSSPEGVPTSEQLEGSSAAQTPRQEGEPQIHIRRRSAPPFINLPPILTPKKAKNTFSSPLSCPQGSPPGNTPYRENRVLDTVEFQRGIKEKDDDAWFKDVSFGKMVTLIASICFPIILDLSCSFFVDFLVGISSLLSWEFIHSIERDSSEIDQIFKTCMMNAVAGGLYNQIFGGSLWGAMVSSIISPIANIGINSVSMLVFGVF